MTKRKKRRDPFGNRINEIKRWDATDEITPFTIKDGFSAAVAWDLPDCYVGIVRSYWLNGKVEERAYRSPSAARKYMDKLVENDCDFTLLTHDQIRDTISHEMEYDDDY